MPFNRRNSLGAGPTFNVQAPQGPAPTAVTGGLSLQPGAAQGPLTLLPNGAVVPQAPQGIVPQPQMLQLAEPQPGQMVQVAQPIQGGPPQMAQLSRPIPANQFVSADIGRQGFIPADQANRTGPTQVLHMQHYDTPLYGCGQVLANEEKLFAGGTPNRIGVDSLCSLTVGSRFADDKQFVIYGIGLQIYFNQLLVPVAGTATSEECYDLACYYSRMELQYQNASKITVWGDQAPAGGGISGYSNVAGSMHLTNGNAASGGFLKLKEAIVIPPCATFYFGWKWLSGIFNAPAPAAQQADPLTRFNAAAQTQKLVRVTIHGLEGRNITNG